MPKKRRPSSESAHVDQPSLLPPEMLFPEEEGPGRSSRSDLPQSSGLDGAILSFIGYFEAVTTHQTIYHFFIYQGKGGRYGFTLLRSLEERGLLRSAPVYPDLGAASLHYVRLTPAGFRTAGLRVPSNAARPLAQAELEYKLQFAEMMLQRNSEGWFPVKDDHKFPEIRRWSLSKYKDRRLNAGEIDERTALERIPPFTLKVPLLKHPGRKWIRIVLPAQHGKNFRRLLGQLPPFTLYPRIPFELVSADAELTSRCLADIERHAKRNKYEYAVEVVPHFSKRPHPRNADKAVRIPQGYRAEES